MHRSYASVVVLCFSLACLQWGNPAMSMMPISGTDEADGKPTVHELHRGQSVCANA